MLPVQVCPKLPPFCGRPVVAIDARVAGPVAVAFIERSSYRDRVAGRTKRDRIPELVAGRFPGKLVSNR